MARPNHHWDTWPDKCGLSIHSATNTTHAQLIEASLNRVRWRLYFGERTYDHEYEWGVPLARKPQLDQVHLADEAWRAIYRFSHNLMQARLAAYVDGFTARPLGFHWIPRGGKFTVARTYSHSIVLLDRSNGEEIHYGCEDGQSFIRGGRPAPVTDPTGYLFDLARILVEVYAPYVPTEKELLEALTLFPDFEKEVPRRQIQYRIARKLEELEALGLGRVAVTEPKARRHGPVTPDLFNR